MIRLSDVALRLSRPGQRASIQFAISDFEVTRGEAVGLTGASGCGKSTLLNLIAGLRRPDSGEVWVDDTELSRLPTAKLDRYRGSTCGIVHQTFHLLAPFTAVENVEIGLRFGVRRRGDLRGQAEEVLERVGLRDRLHARPKELSVGERQRVAIARAIVGDAPVLLADEPTGSLDPVTGREIFELLRTVAEEDGRTLLMVTHDHSLAKELPRVFDCSELVRTTATEGSEAKR